MAEQAFGRWTITDRIGSRLPKKCQVDIELDGEDLRFRTADGEVETAYPASACRYDAYGRSNGFLGVGGEAMWLKAESEQAAVALETALAERYVPSHPVVTKPEPDPVGPMVTKVYRAATPDEAARLMAADAERLSGFGYALVSQSWAEPNRSSQVALRVGGVIATLVGLLFLAAFFVAVVIWVVAVLLFALSVGTADEGSLLATYERRADPASATTEPTAAAEPGPIATVSARDRLLELTALRDEGLVTDDEWASKREAILRDL
jgi:hypothetical protein